MEINAQLELEQIAFREQPAGSKNEGGFGFECSLDD